MIIAWGSVWGNEKLIAPLPAPALTPAGACAAVAANWPRSHVGRDADRGQPWALPAREPRAMPLNTKNLFLISPGHRNQFILISILTSLRAAGVDC
jgi:hypothetical protein